MSYKSIALATAVLGVCVLLASSGWAKGLQGDYLESRTCDVYTGPCFANAEVSLAGEEAIMAWSIDRGEFRGVDLTGLRVVMAIKGSDTLGFGGGMNVRPEPIRAVVIVDEKADDSQRRALVEFARESAGEAAGSVVRVDAAPIEMSLDHIRMVGHVKAGHQVEILTRKLEEGDHCCTNEIIFYPPLANVENYSPAYTVDGYFAGRGLGLHWANPKSRSAFLATFAE